MAPRNGKNQGKRNNIKIKSKINTQKRGQKAIKKANPTEKPLDSLKWLNKVAVENGVKPCKAVPNWLDACVYKQGVTSFSSEANTSESVDYAQNDVDEKSTSSDGSDECECAHSRFSEINKYGILKRKLSSNSLVAKYIKSGMDHVASFIVESAIRFGEQHGVVVPDRHSPNVYEITVPSNRFDDKSRKIRFKIPEKCVDYDDAKKSFFRNHPKSVATGCRRELTPVESKVKYSTPTTSWGSASDSLDEILPLLKKLKEGGGGIVNSDLDLEKLRTEDKSEHSRKRQRVKEKFRTISKRYKSVGAISDRESDDRDYSPPNKSKWKMYKKDSLELGRQRLRASTCPRKQESESQPSF